MTDREPMPPGAAPLLLIGCGKMGGALLGGWRARGFDPAAIVVVEPNAVIAGRVGAEHGVRTVASCDAVAAGFAPRVVVFAVKPQAMDAVAPAYRRFVGPDTVFLSIAAGTPIAYFNRVLGAEALVVRAMPNTPAAIGQGISVLVANPATSAVQRAACGALMAAVGDHVWVADEDLFDAVTAVSGSGPAYVFLLIECLAEAGIAVGLPADLATRLARATVAGAGALAQGADEPAASLRRDVTSPGGTTEAALAVLMADDGLKPLLARAVAAATARSRRLAASSS